jgi:mannosylglycoprotein endo-beta-mannosidase
MAAINSFYNNRTRDFDLLNKANIILIPKKDGAEEIGDFRPISLIHSVAKIITKTLALRLAPFMNTVISPCQSAFIKRRSIHDNFLYVRNLTRRFHRSQTPTLIIKLDISKAFDSVRWDYLLSVLERTGFPARWRDWIASLLTSATSRVVLNGSPLELIQHGRGLRQGDPLSPLLFVLAIDPLHRLLQVATERGLLSKLKGRAASSRVSMYADDAVLFLKPTA